MESPVGEYTYNTQIPYMMQKITEKSPGYTGVDRDGMTSMQVKLWDMIWRMKERVNADPEFCNAPAAIRQFTMERWVWGKYWPVYQFPGVYPTPPGVSSLPPQKNKKLKISGETPSLAKWSAAHPPPPIILPPTFSTPSTVGSPQPKYSFEDPRIKFEAQRALSNASFSENADINQYSFLMPNEYRGVHFEPQLPNQGRHQTPSDSRTKNEAGHSDAYAEPEAYSVPLAPPHSSIPDAHAAISAASHPFELSLKHSEMQGILNNILRFKSDNYEPQHGWDPATGLPKYAVLNLAPDAHEQWFGPKAETGVGGNLRFERVRAEFAMFRIMFQRLNGGAVIAWVEARDEEMARSLNAGGMEWDEFRKVWAFLRTWAEHGNSTGQSENIVDHLVQCRSIWMNFDTDGLEPPVVQDPSAAIMNREDAKVENQERQPAYGRRGEKKRWNGRMAHGKPNGRYKGMNFPAIKKENLKREWDSEY